MGLKFMTSLQFLLTIAGFVALKEYQGGFKKVLRKD